MKNPKTSHLKNYLLNKLEKYNDSLTQILRFYSDLSKVTDLAK